MNSYFKSFIWLVIFLWFLSPFKLKADVELPFYDPDIAISMDFQDAGLKDILKIFSIQSGLNFIASEGVQERKITLYLDKVPVKEAMDKLFAANNLSYELDKEANIFIVKDWGKPTIETITKVFYLKHATVSSSSLTEEMANTIGAQATTQTGAGGYGGGTATTGGKWTAEQDVGITKAVKKLLSEYGTVIEDFRTNSLVVTDIPSRMPIISQTIAALDVPIKQVMLEVEMLDVSKNTLERIGLKFGDITNYPSIVTMTLTGASYPTKFPFYNLWPHGEGNLTAGTLSFNPSANSYRVVLDFIKSQTDTKYLARPRILSLNNETAEIKITTDEVVGERLSYDERGVLTARQAERMQTGVFLRVTPQINAETGEITMFLNPKVTEASTSAFSSSYRDAEERGTKAKVKVKDGETVIVGGLIRHEFSETITKLPLFGDLPLLGRFFRHKNREKGKERELLVFITPHIVQDKGVELARGVKPSLPEREQSSVLAAERQIAISTSLNNLEKKKK